MSIFFNNNLRNSLGKFKIFENILIIFKKKNKKKICKL